MNTQYRYETLICTFYEEISVMHVQLNRPKAKNAMNTQMFTDVKNCFKQIDKDLKIHAVIISGGGNDFTAGLDLKEAASSLFSFETDDPARRAYRVMEAITDHQGSNTAIEKCRIPVIAAVEGYCLGAGIDVITACDIRLCSKTVKFSIKEIDAGIVPDLGTIQRMVKVVGSDSWVRELTYTGRIFNSEEAFQQGLVSKVLENHESLLKEAFRLAKEISEKSPVVINGIKYTLNYARDHSIQEGLEQIKLLNGSYLQSEDLMKAMQGFMEKKKPQFAKL